MFNYRKEYEGGKTGKEEAGMYVLLLEALHYLVYTRSLVLTLILIKLFYTYG
jgi:hypothetical protein